MLACAHPAFDGPVILFEDVIEILHGSMLAIVVQSTFGLSRDNRRVDNRSACRC